MPRSLLNILARLRARRAARVAARAGQLARAPELGMTLLEIMIVLAIIGLIAGSIGVGVFNQFKKAQLKTAKQQANEISEAVQRYMMSNNSQCPASVDDLVAQKELSKKPRDPWNKDFIVRCPGQINPEGADVVSTGPDKQEGTPDDIRVPEGAPTAAAP